MQQHGAMLPGPTTPCWQRLREPAWLRHGRQHTNGGPAGPAHLQALLANNLSRTKCCTWGLQTATALVKGGGGDAGCIARSLRSLTRCCPPATNTRTLHAAPVTPEEHHEEAATNYDTANTHPYAPAPQKQPTGIPSIDPNRSVAFPLPR